MNLQQRIEAYIDALDNAASEARSRHLADLWSQSGIEALTLEELEYLDFEIFSRIREINNG